MATPLNRIPGGLLDFFGIKSGGWGPRTFGQELNPNLDLLRFYTDPTALEISHSSSLAVSTNTGAIPIASTAPIDLTTGGELVVPNDEIWFLAEADINWQFDDASQIADFAIGCTVQGGSPPTRLLPMGAIVGFTTGAAAPLRGGGRSLRQPYFALGGATLKIFQYGVTMTAGAVAYRVSFRLQRMKR